MRGWLPGRVLSGPCGSGPAGGLPLRKGWAADCRALVCGVVGLSGDWCRRHARLLLLPACVGEQFFYCAGPCGWCGGLFFLCLHSFAARGGWWVWVRLFGVGHNSFMADKHTVGFTFNTV